MVRDTYLDEDVHQAVARFARSAEFREVLAILGDVTGAEVVDLGSGRGVAAYGFAAAGARRVYAVEPDASEDIGRGAIRAVRGELPIEILDGVGEQLPLESQSADVVYGRQVFHHAQDLDAMARECGRVLRDDGRALICREHVVDDEQELEQFLAAHPVHHLTGEENAHSLERYLAAFASAGLDVERVLGPWDSIINAFPSVRSADELSAYPVTLLGQKFGRLGTLAAKVPGVTRLVWVRIRQPVPGRMYSFLARRKPRAEPS